MMDDLAILFLLRMFYGSTTYILQRATFGFFKELLDGRFSGFRAGQSQYR